jgi:uncharacterized RDD family membrane protein YckC
VILLSLKYCPKCGNQLEPDSIFCDACGADLRTRKDVGGKPEVKSEIPQEKPVQSKPLTTPGGVQYADFLYRFVALIIDGIIIAIITGPITWALFPSRWLEPWSVWWQNSLISYLIGFLYFWLLESYNKGQTVGKLALKLRTVDEKTFAPSDPGKYALNNLLKAGSFLFILDFIIGILSNSGDPQKRLRIMQNVSETVVIRES